MDIPSILSYFPPEIASRLQKMPVPPASLREIRLRAGVAPVVVGEKAYLIEGEKIPSSMIQRTAQRMCQNSMYAKQEELRHGFMILPGGHRAGFCGKTVIEGGKVRALSEISSMNLRLHHSVIGAADGVLPALVYGKDVYNTLVVSPPGAGKTTMLRDLARQLGSEKYGFRVGIADERGELAAMYHGTPQMDVGIFTDVYDGCPKAEAMQMLLRGMTPQVVITDELGTEEEGEALCALLHAGVRVICSMHGRGREDVLAHPKIGPLLRAGRIEKIVILKGVGMGATIL